MRYRADIRLESAHMKNLKVLISQVTFQALLVDLCDSSKAFLVIHGEDFVVHVVPKADVKYINLARVGDA